MRATIADCMRLLRCSHSAPRSSVHSSQPAPLAARSSAQSFSNCCTSMEAKEMREAREARDTRAFSEGHAAVPLM
eukprot:scaffold23468_cov71-Phaeocystis_antarctica.AAC.1